MLGDGDVHAAQAIGPLCDVDRRGVAIGHARSREVGVAEVEAEREEHRQSRLTRGIVRLTRGLRRLPTLVAPTPCGDEPGSTEAGLCSRCRLSSETRSNPVKLMETGNHPSARPILKLSPRIIVFRRFLAQLPKLDVAGSTSVARSLRTLRERGSRREFCEKKPCRYCRDQQNGDDEIEVSHPRPEDRSLLAVEIDRQGEDHALHDQEPDLTREGHLASRRTEGNQPDACASGAATSSGRPRSAMPPSPTDDS